MALTVAKTTDRKASVFYCPQCGEYKKADFWPRRSSSGGASDFDGDVCSDCRERTGRVARGLPAVKPKAKRYERMKKEDPDKYHEIQEEKHEKQLKKIDGVLAVAPRPLNKGALVNYEEVANKVQEYFETTALASDMDAIDQRVAAAPTLTGLANALGVGVGVLKTYREREFVDADQMTIKAIVMASAQMIAQYAEENLYTHKLQGAKFHLSKLLPEVFGDDDRGHAPIVAIIDSGQRNKVLKYIAKKQGDKIVAEPHPEGVEAEIVEDSSQLSEYDKATPEVIRKKETSPSGDVS